MLPIVRQTLANYNAMSPARAVSGTDIFRRVPNEADDSILPEPSLRLSHTVAKDIDSHFAMIAKTAKGEVLPQTSRCDFVPAYRFQISRSDAQQFSGSL